MNLRLSSLKACLDDDGYWHTLGARSFLGKENTLKMQFADFRSTPVWLHGDPRDHIMHVDTVARLIILGTLAASMLEVVRTQNDDSQAEIDRTRNPSDLITVIKVAGHKSLRDLLAPETEASVVSIVGLQRQTPPSQVRGGSPVRRVLWPPVAPPPFPSVILKTYIF